MPGPGKKGCNSFPLPVRAKERLGVAGFGLVGRRCATGLPGSGIGGGAGNFLAGFVGFGAGGWSDGILSVNAGIMPDDANSVMVVLIARVFGRSALETVTGRTFNPARMSDWRILKSNGTLEREWQDAIEAQCAGAAVPSPASTP